VLVLFLFIVGMLLNQTCAYFHLDVSRHLKPRGFSLHLETMSYVMRVTVVIDMHFYPCIQDIIETTGLSKSNYNSSKPH